MITREQLSELLRQVDAKAIAAEAGVNIKTIYRLRHGENSPRLELVERLVAACRKLKGRKPGSA
jgi:transcriptional regulator with XRE-family HTH domain